VRLKLAESEFADIVPAGFLRQEALPIPESTSTVAATMLTIKCKQRYVMPCGIVDTVLSLLCASTKTQVVCEVCTVDPARPFLVEEGDPMSAHKGSRGHRRAIQKQQRRHGRDQSFTPTSHKPTACRSDLSIKSQD
jgi:tRNA dimethylallyltransferase